MSKKQTQEHITKRLVALKRYYLEHPRNKRKRDSNGKFIKDKIRTISGVYIILHSSGRLYVGSAKNILRRFTIHKQNLRNNCHVSKKMQSDWNDLGESSFTLEIIEEIQNVKERLIREQLWIDFFKPEYNFSYFVNAGKILGKNLKGLPKGYKFSEKAVQSFRDSWTTERKAAYSKYAKEHGIIPPRNNSKPPSHLGRKRSEETKAKQRAVWTEERKEAQRERKRIWWENKKLENDGSGA